MTKEKILFDIETLKHNINVLMNENSNNVPQEKTIVYYQTFPDVYYQTFPEELDFLFSMVHFHKTNYEHYLFIDKYIFASLKEGISEKYKEIKNWERLKNKQLESLSSLDKESISCKKGERQNHISKESCAREIQVCDFRINELNSQINDVKEIIRTHKTYKKDEELLSEQNKPLYNAWLKLKNAKIEFNNTKNGIKIDISTLKEQIATQEKEMQEVIDRYNF